MKMYAIVDTHPESAGAELSSHFADGSPIWVALEKTFDMPKVRELEVGAERNVCDNIGPWAVRRVS